MELQISGLGWENIFIILNYLNFRDIINFIEACPYYAEIIKKHYVCKVYCCPCSGCTRHFCLNKYKLNERIEFTFSRNINEFLENLICNFTGKELFPVMEDKFLNID